MLKLQQSLIFIFYLRQSTNKKYYRGEKMNRVELEKILSGDIDITKRLFIWGVGNTSNLYQEGLNRLEKEGIFIDGYVDNNEEKWGKTFGNNKRIYSPNEIINLSNILVLITSPQPRVINEISKQLDNMGLLWMHIDEFVLKIHRNDVLSCYDLFIDEKSKSLYAELIRCRLFADYPTDNYVDKEQYFSFRNFGEYDPNEVFVDCGAYVGDSLENYIWRTDGTFKKIIAFEPDIENVKAINARLERLKKEWNLKDDKFEIYPYGISDKNSTSYIERYEINNGFGSKLKVNKTIDSVEIVSVSIDEYIKEPIGFIKADIESYEYKLIIGAKKCIEKYQPKLAICIYHNVVDFYSIPLLIHEICPDYNFSIRHYTHVLSDTVLYAYI